MKSNKAIIIFLGAILLGCLMFGGGALAQTLWDSQMGLESSVGQAYGTPGEPEDIRLIVARIIKVFLGLLGIIFLALLIVAGFRWMTAGGNETQISQSKKQISAAIIGLIIIMAAYSLTVFVIDRVYGATSDTSSGGYYNLFH